MGVCLVSTYEPDVKATKYTYVERDTIIAALSDIIYVIECGINSGTLHTVEAAYSLNKRIACYYNSDSNKGNFEGNKYMLEKKEQY